MAERTDIVHNRVLRLLDSWDLDKGTLLGESTLAHLIDVGERLWDLINGASTTCTGRIISPFVKALTKGDGVGKNTAVQAFVELFERDFGPKTSLDSSQRIVQLDRLKQALTFDDPRHWTRWDGRDFGFLEAFPFLLDDLSSGLREICKTLEKSEQRNVKDALTQLDVPHNSAAALQRVHPSKEKFKRKVSLLPLPKSCISARLDYEYISAPSVSNTNVEGSRSVGHECTSSAALSLRGASSKSNDQPRQSLVPSKLGPRAVRRRTQYLISCAAVTSFWNRVREYICKTWRSARRGAPDHWLK